MTCPFCDAKMKEVAKQYICPGDGPLLTKESGTCPYQGKPLTEQEIDNIIIFLIDNDGGD